jgi:hypothetical protein
MPLLDADPRRCLVNIPIRLSAAGLLIFAATVRSAEPVFGKATGSLGENTTLASAMNESGQVTRLSVTANRSSTGRGFSTHADGSTRAAEPDVCGFRPVGLYAFRAIFNSRGRREMAE